MKNILLIFFTLVAFVVFFTACEKDKEEGSVQTNKSIVEDELSRTSNNFFEAYFVIDGEQHKWIANTYEEPLEVEWYMNINTENESVSEFVFDFSDYPDVEIVEFSENMLIININGINGYFNIDYTDNEMNASLLDFNNDNCEIATMNFYSEDFDFNSIMDYCQIMIIILLILELLLFLSGSEYIGELKLLLLLYLFKWNAIEK